MLSDVYFLFLFHKYIIHFQNFSLDAAHDTFIVIKTNIKLSLFCMVYISAGITSPVR